MWPWSIEWRRAKANRVFPRQHSGHSKHPLPTTQEKTLHMDITKWSTSKVRLIIFFAAKDKEALYSQQKQDWKRTVAQIMNSSLPNSDLNWRKQGKPLDHSGMTWIKPLTIIQWKWEIDSRDYIWWTECLKNYRWRFVTLYKRQWLRPSARKRNAKRQNGCLRRPYK